MNLPMPNAQKGEKRNFFVLRAWVRPVRCGVPGLCLSANPNKEKQKEKQKHYHDTRHQHDEPADETKFDEDSRVGEAERPMPLSEKPESCQK